MLVAQPHTHHPSALSTERSRDPRTESVQAKAKTRTRTPEKESKMGERADKSPKDMISKDVYHVCGPIGVIRGMISQRVVFRGDAMSR